MLRAAQAKLCFDPADIWKLIRKSKNDRRTP
jgi:hypothetical protein